MDGKQSKKELRDRWSTDKFVIDKQVILDSVFRQKRCREKADLKGLVVGLDGPIDWLAWADLHEAELENIDFSFARFSCSFGYGRFNAVCFESCYFDTCRFFRASFTKVDFAKALIVSPWLEEAVFIACRFKGSRIRGRGRVLPNSSGSHITFERCDFENTAIDHISMADVDFIDCNFENAEFRGCRVFNWRFRGGAPTQHQLLGCEYRGHNTGLCQEKTSDKD